MFTKVSFKYENEYIISLFVAVHPTIFSEPYYVIMGVNNSAPLVIGELGFFKNFSSAFERIKSIAEKYPPIDYVDSDTEVPEFTVI